MGKLKCGNCKNVFKSRNVVLKDYVPQNKRPTRKISDAQEKANAKKLGGQRTAGSGSVPNPVHKGDVRAHDLRLECKSTGKKSFSLKLEDLKKIQSQARGDEIPVFSVEFRGTTKEEFYILPEAWFLQLLEAYRAQDDS